MLNDLDSKISELTEKYFNNLENFDWKEAGYSYEVDSVTTSCGFEAIENLGKRIKYARKVHFLCPRPSVNDIVYTLYLFCRKKGTVGNTAFQLAWVTERKVRLVHFLKRLAVASDIDRDDFYLFIFSLSMLSAGVLLVINFGDRISSAATLIKVILFIALTAEILFFTLLFLLSLTKILQLKGKSLYPAATLRSKKVHFSQNVIIVDDDYAAIFAPHTSEKRDELAFVIEISGPNVKGLRIILEKTLLAKAKVGKPPEEEHPAYNMMLEKLNLKHISK